MYDNLVKNDDQYWDVISGEKAGFPMTGLVSKPKADFDYAAFPWFVKIVFDIVHTDARGLPTAEDSIILDNLEDKILDVLYGSVILRQAARITWKGTRTVYLYAHSAEAIEGILRTFGASSTYRFSFACEHDPEWSIIKSILPQIMDSISE